MMSTRRFTHKRMTAAERRKRVLYRVRFVRATIKVSLRAVETRLLYHDPDLYRDLVKRVARATAHLKWLERYG